MSEIVLALPEKVLELVRQKATETRQSVDELVAGSILRIYDPEFALPAEERAELDAMRSLSDDALWTLARETLDPDVDEEMQGLMDLNDFGTISETQYARLEELVDKGQRLMLRKGTAMAILTERGHAIKEHAPWKGVL